MYKRYFAVDSTRGRKALVLETKGPKRDNGIDPINQGPEHDWVSFKAGNSSAGMHREQHEGFKRIAMGIYAILGRGMKVTYMNSDGIS